MGNTREEAKEKRSGIGSRNVVSVEMDSRAGPARTAKNIVRHIYNMAGNFLGLQLGRTYVYVQHMYLLL